MPPKETRVWVKASLLATADAATASGRTLTSLPISARKLSRTSSSSCGIGVAAGKGDAATASTLSTATSTDSLDGDDWSVSSSSQPQPPPLSPATSLSAERSSTYDWREGWMTKNDNNADSSSFSSTVTVRVPSESPCLEDAQLILSAEHMEREDVVPANDGPNFGCSDDLVHLQHFNEPSVVECLHRRYRNCDVYTAIGPVLLAVNPFHPVSHIYGDDVMERYWTAVEKGAGGAGTAPTPARHPVGNDVPPQPQPLPPHVYAVADRAFRGLMRGIQLSLGNRATRNSLKFDQCILVSGESGSGKTVSTKHLMQYLAALSRRAALQAAGGPGGARRAHEKAKGATRRNNKAPTVVPPRFSLPSRPPTTTEVLSTLKSHVLVTPPLPSDDSFSSSLAYGIESQVLQSNPILESFGNARTVRNDNSSRFGKFLEMQFTLTGRLVGTRIETYLLEKVRVVQQSPGERNYHVFYELLSGALPQDDADHLHLRPDAAPHHFRLLSGGDGTRDRRDGVLDRDTFRQLRKAMTTMGMDHDERLNVFAVIAAILHASNLTFREAENDGSAIDTSKPHLEAACDLLGVTPEDLGRALCLVNLAAGGTVYQKPLSVPKAEKGLEAFLKATYAALFAFLVQRINSTIAYKRESSAVDESPNASPMATIGILDIFGFESFQTNSFEQLCINYCNEALQQQFNTFLLKNEQAEYVSEGLDWDFIKFPENQDVLDLLGHRTSGVFAILDDMCRAPGATDQAFALDVYKCCDGKPRFEAGRARSVSPTFSINHYAGPVEYSVAGFVEKNRDDLPRETSEFLARSSKPLLHQLGAILAGSNLCDRPSGQQAVNAGGSTRPTVSSHFRQQVRDLRSKIDATSPHYVRCIKPNAVLTPGRFDSALVAHQLRCGGVLQAVSITRAGFTLHYTHADFVKRYRVLADKEFKVPFRKPGSSGLKTESQLCESLVDELLSLIPAPVDDATNETEVGVLNSEKEACEKLIQFGKSKVLLKHHAFESLERMVASIHSTCATAINAWCRRHLCRVAFLSVRESFRLELKSMGTTFEEWFRDNREIYYQPRNRSEISIPNIVRQRREMFAKNAAHRANSRHDGGTTPQKVVTLENAAWIILDGLWSRNPSYNN